MTTLSFDLLVVPGADPRGTVDTVRFVEEHGFDGAWIGDSPPLGWADVYATLALCSAATSRITLGPGVTNPITRHSSVTANAMVTLHQLAGGRTALGIGVGDSALRAQGMRPARLETLEDYIGEVRRLCKERKTYIPVYIAASGPKTLRLAGRLADGAIISVGTHPSLVKQALAEIAVGAHEVARTPGDIDLLFIAGLAVASTWDEAKREAAPVAARRAKDAQYHPDFFFPADLEHLRAEAENVARHYDYKDHMNPDAPHTRFVTDAIADAYTLAGTPDTCAAKLEAMAKVGVRRVALLPTGRDRRGAMDLFVTSVLPSFL
jgi:5,10-methylenetetrahydromethanopterin reductase